MPDDSPSPRLPRADSQRNRERLLGVAKAAFTQENADVALEEIARRAGVGIGTLYRHFPDRGALLAAVYRRELEQLTAAADALLAEGVPIQALEGWLEQLVDYMATKRVIAPALQASPKGAEAYAAAGPVLSEALERLVRAGVASGDIRADMRSEDLMRLIAGVSYGYDKPDWEPSARRLIGVLVAGLRSGG
ncbi:MAG TPA: TetR/AcrR family transcriptional regulator [Caulobacteraceae bacterium]|jgi:AcrR family transcriptional regulator|nr:TetR/AcrR family transcriptional regulator [Caulobacteraceae bacterium]